MLAKLFFVLSFLKFFDVCHSIFESNQTCVPNGCTLTCQEDQINLQSAVMYGSTNQRFYTKEMIGGTKYFITIPLCGAYSTSSTLDFSQSSIFKSLPDGSTFNLGLYTPNSTITSWTMGSCGDDVAISATFYNGTYCSDIESYTETTLYLMCDPRYNARYPAIMVLEPTTCHYAIQMSMIEICDYIPSDATPVLSPTLSPAITRSPANYYAASTSCIVDGDDDEDKDKMELSGWAIFGIVVGAIFVCGFCCGCCIKEQSPAEHIAALTPEPSVINTTKVPNTIPYTTIPSGGSGGYYGNVYVESVPAVSYNGDTVKPRVTIPTAYSGSYVSVSVVDHSVYGYSGPQQLDNGPRVVVTQVGAESVVYAEAV